jgi:hypothetical protein
MPNLEETQTPSSQAGPHFSSTPAPYQPPGRCRVRGGGRSARGSKGATGGKGGSPRRWTASDHAQGKSELEANGDVEIEAVVPAAAAKSRVAVVPRRSSARRGELHGAALMIRLQPHQRGKGRR